MYAMRKICTYLSEYQKEHAYPLEHGTGHSGVVASDFRAYVVEQEKKRRKNKHVTDKDIEYKAITDIKNCWDTHIKPMDKYPDRMRLTSLGEEIATKNLVLFAIYAFNQALKKYSYVISFVLGGSIATLIWFFRRLWDFFIG